MVQPSALLTEDGQPGVTMRFFPLKPNGEPAPTSLMEKFMRAMTGAVAETPSATPVVSRVNYEVFTQPL